MKIKCNYSQWYTCVLLCCICRLTLVEAYDVGVPERGGDLDLSLDVNSVQVVGDALLADRLDSHLREKTHHWVCTCFMNPSVQITHILISLVIKCGWLTTINAYWFLNWALELIFHSKKTALGYQRTVVTPVRLCTSRVVVLHFHRGSGASKHRFLFN